jgi:hypothetical protein
VRLPLTQVTQWAISFEHPKYLTLPQRKKVIRLICHVLPQALNIAVSSSLLDFFFNEENSCE